MDSGRKKPRFNSFELSDSESQTNNIKDTILHLQSFFPKEAKEFDELDKIIESNNLDEGKEDEDGFIEIPVYKLDFVYEVRRDLKCLETMKDIIRQSNHGNQTEFLTWEKLIKAGFKIDKFLSFTYTLMKLIEVNKDDKANRDLSCLAGQTYICLLGLPGAKRCLIWNSDLVIAFFKLIQFMHQHSSSDNHYVDILILQMLTQMQMLFNVVSLTDQEEVLEKYIEMLANVLSNFLSSTNSTAYEINTICYKNLESLCLKPLPDEDIEKILYLIFCRTIDLHFITQKKGSTRQSINTKQGELISDFFLRLLATYFDKTKNVLTKFIRSLLSNLDHKFEKEKYQKLFDLGVKYENAIYSRSNESIVEYLEKLSLAADAQHRINCVEFCGKMLILETSAESKQLIENQDSLCPRETRIIKILFEKIRDKQDSVKLKALTALKTAIMSGNENVKMIFKVIFKRNANRDNPELETLSEVSKLFQNYLRFYKAC